MLFYCSSKRSYDYFDYFATLGPDSGFDRCYPHTDPIVMAD